MASLGRRVYIAPMCGCYLLYAPAELLGWAFGFEFSETARELGRRFNIASSQRVPIVRNQAGRELTIRADGESARELDVARWGLIPTWAKDSAIGYEMINARSETVADKRAFRSTFKTPGRSSRERTFRMAAARSSPT